MYSRGRGGREQFRNRGGGRDLGRGRGRGGSFRGRGGSNESESGSGRGRGRSSFRSRGGSNESERGSGRGRGRGGSFRGQGERSNESESESGSGINKDPKELELNKPWVNYELKCGILKKHQLKETSSKTKKREDLEAYQAQRSLVKELTKEARNNYFEYNPGSENKWLPILALEASRDSSNYCEMCEITFDSEDKLEEHENEHDTCGLDGCTFTANANILEKHILHLHASGLYNRIVRGDDPEEIKKWREERKRNYPKQSDIEERETKRAEKQKTLEVVREKRAEEYRKFIERRKEKQLRFKEERLKKSQKKRQQRKQKPRHQLENFLDDEEDPPGTNWGLKMFPGTSAFINVIKNYNDDQKEEEEEEDKIPLDIADSSEDMETNKNDESSEEPPDEIDISKTSKEFNELNEEDSEAPEEIKTKKSEDDEEGDIHENGNDNDTEMTVEKESADCGNPSEASSKSRTRSHKHSKRKSENSKNDETKPAIKIIRKKRRPPTLLEKLLEADIRKERSELLQCVKYVCGKNFFMK